jgi:hypothetical protein
MGIVDKAKEMLGGHTDQAKDGVDKAANMAEEKTGGKYDDKIEMGADKAKDGIDTQSKSGNMGQAGTSDMGDKAQNMGQNAMDEAQERMPDM